MKVRFIGTGTMGSTTRCNQSLLVDNILFDIGSGTVKQLERLGISTRRVQYVVISHFHSDHFLDITNFLIGRSIRKELTEKIYVIGPKGLKKAMLILFNLTHADGDIDKYANIEKKFNMEIIELQNGKTFKQDDFKLTAYSLKHGFCRNILGFILEKENQKIAYATDTAFCPNLEYMLQNTSYAFCDATHEISTTMHIGAEQLYKLAYKYYKCKVYAIHRGDYDTKKYDYLFIPQDGDELLI